VLEAQYTHTEFILFIILPHPFLGIATKVHDFGEI
jgi:hypothetical protein